MVLFQQTSDILDSERRQGKDCVWGAAEGPFGVVINEPGILIRPESLEELGSSQKSKWGWMCEMLYMFVPALWMFSCPAKSEVSDQFFSVHA